jgi:hypothetical protein
VLTGAGVQMIHPRSGGEPRPVFSGTGPEVVAAFDPRRVAEAAARAA